MAQLIQNVQVQIKKSSQSALLFGFRLLSGILLGLVLAIAGETLIGYEQLSFTLVVVLFSGVFLRISRGWSFGGLFVYNLVCVLLGLLLRMYILMAPGQ